MIEYDQIAAACSANDNRLFDATFDALEVTIDDVVRAAGQRALRLVVLERPDGEEQMAAMVAEGAATPMALTNIERVRFQAYQAIWVDGLVAGLQAMKTSADAHHAAFVQGYTDGREIGPDGELSMGMTYDDPALNEAYDQGVNAGQGA